MKKVILSIVFFFYALLSIGVNIKVHYCGNKITGFTLLSHTTDNCCCAKKKATKSCCKTDAHYLQLKSDIVKKEVAFNFSSATVYSLFHTFFSTDYSDVNNQSHLIFCSAIPSKNAKQERIALNVFRI